MTSSASVTWTLSGFGDEIDPHPHVQIGGRSIANRIATASTSRASVASRARARGLRVEADVREKVTA